MNQLSIFGFEHLKYVHAYWIEWNSICELGMIRGVFFGVGNCEIENASSVILFFIWFESACQGTKVPEFACRSC